MFDDQAWVVWLGLALVLVGVEAATVDFTFLMLAGGALGGTVAAAMGAPFAAQAVVSAVVAVVLLLTVRPWLKEHFTVAHRELMGAQANVGRSAYVLDRVGPASGRIKLAGETWSARSTGATIEPGEEVIVESIDGATAVVSRARVAGG
ncbi:MAG TPA: NfeD family protein [Intrasporangium sp.]|uniref:NfeD family protein n=1 Tax=Intrasporangium sp. TaxID=1925024 RepID=UPI002D77778B|nr:NfeD family protein [Intrasporangium sp.]HET7398091.1 NfeD family protein [Intrasporangium sp.]